MNKNQKQQRMHLNTLIDIEETMLRLKLKQDPLFALSLLTVFRPRASLRQLNNSIKKPLNKDYKRR